MPALEFGWLESLLDLCILIEVNYILHCTFLRSGRRCATLMNNHSRIRCGATQKKRLNLSLTITIPTLDDPDLTTKDDQVENASSSSSPVSGLSDQNSLFDEMDPVPLDNTPGTPPERHDIPAIRNAPDVQGLFFDPTLRLPEEFAERVTEYCMNSYFQHEDVNQVMLFGRFVPAQSSSEKAFSTGLPPILHELLSKLEAMLLPIVPHGTHELLFPRAQSRARQAILNLYKPGEGITPHVDLLRRFGDGIIGVSFGSGCVMRFARVGDSEEEVSQSNTKEERKKNWNVYLPERSIIVLSEDARYKWTHGIEKCTEDYVERHDAGSEWIKRGVRLSITFRWLLPGADVVGE
ncbi:hypothetical protein H0H93_007584 [Arthromyces matolae]|nr:hypothetical protein H0H93_007584 [Arthromyces matolae]